ncbi:MAG TPA: hypothetical protein VK365_10015 [Nocardioidaceae bacterium]|jgi:ribosomal 50S subunit-associated protein YjgA (DUF615 family)|nr:hypothetical protein [Nocardioidaceae bacterium]
MLNLLTRTDPEIRRARRAARAERSRLRAELASYRTPAELLELDAILERHPDADAEPVRRLIRQLS